jgi:CBS domain-containing protein
MHGHRISDLIELDAPVLRTTSTVAQAALLMAQYGVDALAVVDANRHVVGVLTGGDIVRLVGATGDSRPSRVAVRSPGPCASGTLASGGPPRIART